MDNVTVISRKTPKTKRPVDKRVFFITSSLKKKPIELKKTKKFTIGRASKNTLSIKEGTVSERHASIKWDKSSFKIQDERSTNGTYVNGRRISGVTVLKSGDKIKLGKFVLAFSSKIVREKAVSAPKKKSPAKKAKSRSVKKSKTKSRGARKTSRRAASRRSGARRTTTRRRVTRKKVTRRKSARRPFHHDMAVTRIRF
jgi:pSer/pThr/pTyr-binding forkhead associated (FHA) protein